MVKFYYYLITVLSCRRFADKNYRKKKTVRQRCCLVCCRWCLVAIRLWNYLPITIFTLITKRRIKFCIGSTSRHSFRYFNYNGRAALVRLLQQVIFCCVLLNFSFSHNKTILGVQVRPSSFSSSTGIVSISIIIF